MKITFKKEKIGGRLSLDKKILRMDDGTFWMCARKYE